MLQGKILREGNTYRVKVGSVVVDISDDIRTLIAQEIVHACATYEKELTELRATNADTLDRYNQIARIILADGAGMPTG